MAELRQRRPVGLRLEVAAWLRERAGSYCDRGPDTYEHLGAQLLRRAERLERGDKPEIVRGWELPKAALAGRDPSSPFLLHPDGRLADYQPLSDA